MKKQPPAPVILRLSDIDTVAVFFPDDDHNPGMIGCVEISYYDSDRPEWHPYDEVSLDWYRGCQPIPSGEHKETSARILSMVNNRFGEKYRLVQRLTKWIYKPMGVLAE